MKHIIIDEAQDYNLFQFYLLKKIFPNASFTILGDKYQTMHPYHCYESLSDIKKIFDTAAYIELLKTYRSSEEIIEYTNQILGISSVCAIRRSSNIPVKIKSETELIMDIQKDIHEMKENGLKRLAIITKTEEETEKLYEQLKPQIKELETLTNLTTQAELVILPAILAKGLEYDGVIVYQDNDTYYTKKEKNLFYIVCTRA